MPWNAGECNRRAALLVGIARPKDNHRRRFGPGGPNYLSIGAEVAIVAPADPQPDFGRFPDVSVFFTLHGRLPRESRPPGPALRSSMPAMHLGARPVRSPAGP